MVPGALNRIELDHEGTGKHPTGDPPGGARQTPGMGPTAQAGRKARHGRRDTRHTSRKLYTVERRATFALQAQAIVPRAVHAMLSRSTRGVVVLVIVRQEDGDQFDVVELLAA